MNKFLESICKRVRRSQRKATRSLEKKDRSKLIASSNSRHQLTAAKNIISVVEQQFSVSLSPGVARGNFLDSSYRSGPAMAAAGESGAPASQSLPSSSAITSSAPLLRVHIPAESSPTSEDQAVHQECVESRTSPSALHATSEKMDGQCMLSATDSGLYSEEEEEEEEEEEDSGEEFLEVFSDEEEDEEGLVEEGWQIRADEVSLDTVMAATGRETVYSGYWHGNVAVHALCSNTEETYRRILADVGTLSNIRHENIQLFLGVCHDLHSDYISIIVDQMKGESLHTVIHKQNHKFNFQSLTKITNQVAQGMEYLHAKGIAHPLLTTQSVSLHFRACISMLSPSSASLGVVNSADLPYLPPEVMRTVEQHSGSGQTGLTCPSSPHSVRGLQSRSNSRLSYRLPSSTTSWSTPTSPNLQHTRRQMDNNRLCPDIPVYSPRGSCDDLRAESQCRQRTQLKGDVSTMQTFQANVFSFGTLLYEMLTSEKPFAGTPGNQIIYQVGNGKVHDLKSLRDGKFKQTIRRCWRKEPESRPSFQELLLKFEQNMSPKSCGLKSHFSFSVPNQLDKLGCFETGGLQL